MSKARLVITAIEVEGRSPAEVVAAYGVALSDGLCKSSWSESGAGASVGSTL
jgi:hypothetical protein